MESVDTVEKRISRDPSDYVSPEEDQKKEDKMVKDFQRGSKEQSAGMGTLGDLLQAQLTKKK